MGHIVENMAGRLARSGALLALALVSVSCVPMAAEAPLAAIAPVAAPQPGTARADLPPPVPFTPVAAALHPAPAYAFDASSPLDALRARDCLAQAVYYEARSESEDGQRAVAQVVLNRVRHPAFPNSVCGVVYQGPMRVGGGCQFTFTCDGSLATAPAGEAWIRARRIADEALAGRVFAPVGLATHYHANYVYPAWAPRMIPLAAIGLHDFYRLPGENGDARIFTVAYAGHEPMPRPAAFTPRRTDGQAGLAPLFAATAPAAPAPVRSIPTALADAAPTPVSTIRPEYQNSGQWRADAPAAITGAR